MKFMILLKNSTIYHMILLSVPRIHFRTPESGVFLEYYLYMHKWSERGRSDNESVKNGINISNFDDANKRVFLIKKGMWTK